MTYVIAVAAAVLVLTACRSTAALEREGGFGCASSIVDNGPPAELTGEASFAARPPAGGGPDQRPSQAGPALRGRFPTNRWWTSALTGPWSQPLFAGPIAAQATAAGFAASYQAPQASPDHVIQPFVPALHVGGELEGVEVECYGAFHVTLRARARGGGLVRMLLVQGSPVVWFAFDGVDEPVVRMGASATGDSVEGRQLTAIVDGHRWHLAATAGAWKADGDRLVLKDPGTRATVAASPAPDAVTTDWSTVVSSAARQPPTATYEELAYVDARGVARQRLTVSGAAAKAVWALTPLQRRHLRPRPRQVLGRYATSIGSMTVVRARSIVVEASGSGFVPGAPRVDIGRAARQAVADGLTRDLAQPPMEAGSYFAAKEAARLAAIAEVATAIGRSDLRRRAVSSLRRRLVDWLRYDGPSDPRYFAREPIWGGLVPVPAEFGAQHYNDPHLQLGYFVRAAATLAELDPSFVEDYGSAVDAIVRAYADRVWDAGAGHSWASGFAPFADGNNQESSSEAVAAWSAAARWGLAAGRPGLVKLGLGRYALEAAAARQYWLGAGGALPDGYGHPVVGIVWGGKIDFATWFSPAPSAIHGIQLLPVEFSSLYRNDPRAARVRMRALERSGGITQWSNLFAVEQALYDPWTARRTLERAVEPEPSTSAGLVRYLVEVLAKGRPDPRVTVSPPFGLALKGRGGRRLFLAVNPTGRTHVVSFRLDGRLLARARVPARSSMTRPQR